MSELLSSKKEESLKKLSELLSYLSYEEVAPFFGVTSSYLKNLFYFERKGRKSYCFFEKYSHKIDELYNYYISASKQGRMVIDFLHSLGFSYSEIAVLLGCSSYSALQKLKTAKIWSKKYLDKVDELINREVNERVDGFEYIKDFDFSKWKECFSFLSKIIHDAKVFCIEYQDFTMQGKPLDVKKLLKRLLQDIFEASLFVAKQTKVSIYVVYKYFEHIVINLFSQNGLNAFTEVFKNISNSYLNSKINVIKKSQKFLNSINQEVYLPNKRDCLKEFYKVLIYFEHIISIGKEFLNTVKHHHEVLKQDINFSIHTESIQQVVPMLCKTK